MNLDCDSWQGNLFQPFFQPIDLPQIRFTVAPKAEDVRPVSILRQVGDVTCFSMGGIGPDGPTWVHGLVVVWASREVCSVDAKAGKPS